MAIIIWQWDYFRIFALSIKIAFEHRGTETQSFSLSFLKTTLCLRASVFKY